MRMHSVRNDGPASKKYLSASKQKITRTAVKSKFQYLLGHLQNIHKIYVILYIEDPTTSSSSFCVSTLGL